MAGVRAWDQGRAHERCSVHVVVAQQLCCPVHGEAWGWLTVPVLSLTEMTICHPVGSPTAPAACTGRFVCEFNLLGLSFSEGRERERVMQCEFYFSGAI